MATAKNGEPAAAKAIQFLSSEQREILSKSALCEKLDANQRAYFFEVVERTHLDPFTGQIRPDVRKKTEEDGTKTPALLIIVTLQGLRSIGERTGQLDGEGTVEWCGKDGQWLDVWLADEPPKAARASVYRKDRPRAQTQICRWDAFVQLKKYDQRGELVPGPFWKRMGSHMLGKCSLAGAYRGAFPNQCSGLYIDEELQEVLDPDSEEAIEAEMIRKARAEKAFWDEKAKEGIYPIDVQQQREKAALAQQARPGPELNAIAGGVGGPLGSVVVGTTPPAPLPAASAPPSAPPAPRPTTPPPPPPTDWRNFVISRIEVFQGRTVGSLTEGEMGSLRSWLERAEKAWGSLDAGLKAHYIALRDRLQWEASQPPAVAAPSDQMDFSRL